MKNIRITRVKLEYLEYDNNFHAMHYGVIASSEGGQHVEGNTIFFTQK